MAVANITSIVLPGKFEPNQDKWENYREQLYFALEAAGPLESAQKRALFLSQCGKEAFSLIVSLLSPRKPSEVAFEEIIEVLNKFFTPVPHPILETKKFYSRKQKGGESITSFVAALHEISARCKFDDLHRRVAEQLILGIRDESIRKDLLKIKISDITYDSVVQRALNLEALQQGKEGDNANQEEKIYRDAAHSSTNASTSEPMDVNIISTNTKLCEHCAKRHVSKCRFRNATCFNCHKKGHTKAACNVIVNKQRKMRINECCECSLPPESETSEAEDNFGVHGVSGAALSARVKPYMVEVKINGVPVTMEVDSGSARTILPHSLYRQHREAFPSKLSPCDSKLITWTNDKLKIQGETDVEVDFHGRKQKLRLLVGCGGGPALLGRAWFEALGITLQGVNSVTEECIVEKFPILFDGKMDQYCGPLVHISVKKETSPVYQRARPVPFPLREKVNEELRRMMSDGILTPIKYSKWATPLRIVPKPDGSLRLCGDYRSTVNASCETDSFPLPTANEAFFQISGSKYFSKLDLKHAYNQLKVDAETSELLTLNTPLGLMRMNRLAFGVNAAPGIFQRLMSTVLAGIEGVACLLDDVVVSGSNREEHDHRLELVLQRLEEMKFKLNKKKCIWAAKRVSFLGYEIDEAGVHPLKEKVQEIADKPAPTDKKSLKAFLGLYNFYERFIKEKASVLYPLYRLLKENVKWQWGKAEQEAFDRAKGLLTSDLTLVHYSLKKELVMICDASEYGVGAVLVHKLPDGTEKPVIMGSRTLQEHERPYAQIDKEALAIMFGLKKFRQYLLGRKFSIATDHKPLLGIFGRNKPIPELISPRMLRWALILNTFMYELEYRPGKQIGNADCLSRWPTPAKVSEYETTEEVMLLDHTDQMGVTSKQIAKETGKDSVLCKVKGFLLHGWPNKVEKELEPFYRRKDSLSLSKECILFGNRVVIPAILQKDVLKALHESHSGIVQTKMLARAYVWFPSIDYDIENTVTNCDECQMNRNNPPVTQHTWTPETRPWARIHIDFMGPFMGKTFLVVVDSYSKWPVIEIIPSMSSKTVIDILRRIFADHGLPEIAVSDNGLAFMSQEFQEFMQKNHIKHITGAPYHPATNGQVERTIQTIKNKLKKQTMMSWPERVAKVLFQMRTVPSTVTGKTPAELLNNRKFRTAFSILHPDFDNGTELGKEEERREDEGRRAKKKFTNGDHVLLRMYNTNEKWQRGVIVRLVAPALYEVQAVDGSSHRRHVDQLLRSHPPGDTQTNRRENQDDDDTTSESDSVIIPPPEEWAEIIGI